MLTMAVHHFVNIGSAFQAAYTAASFFLPSDFPMEMHCDNESLHGHVPKEILPASLGGPNRDDCVLEDLAEAFLAAQDFFQELKDIDRENLEEEDEDEDEEED